MDTATREPTKSAKGHTPSAPQPVPIDPEHDMDAKSTVTWLAGALVFVVICMWALAHVFAYDVRRQQYQKIDSVPTEELRNLRAEEDAHLRKQQPVAGDSRSLDDINQSIHATTDRIIEAYLKK